MSHPEQRSFCEYVKAAHPGFFRNRRVLDCGSLDINGSNREFFQDSIYTGIDVGAGKNVDIVCPTHELGLPDGTFDVIVSTECFEHDRYYAESLRNIVRLLKSGGLFFFTCAGVGRPEHGTLRAHPDSSPLTTAVPGWDTYYRNLTETDVREAIDVNAVFGEYKFEVNTRACDLYFWGIKR